MAGVTSALLLLTYTQHATPDMALFTKVNCGALVSKSFKILVQIDSGIRSCVHLSIRKKILDPVCCCPALANVETRNNFAMKVKEEAGSLFFCGCQ